MSLLGTLPLMLALGASPTATSTSAALAPPVSTARRLPVSLSYFGEALAHPGLRVASELTLARSGGHQLLLEPALGGSFHRGHSLGLFAEGLLGYRYTFDVGLRAEAVVGLGYLHTLADGTVYAPSSAGGFDAVTNLGRPAALASAALGLGWEFARTSGAPVSAFLRPRLTYQTPYHHSGRLGLAVELGLSWTLPL